MWQVVYVASNKKEVDSILKIMESQGFMLQIKAEAGEYQIKVPALEAEAAYSCLNKIF